MSKKFNKIDKKKIKINGSVLLLRDEVAWLKGTMSIFWPRWDSLDLPKKQVDGRNGDNFRLLFKWPCLFLKLPSFFLKWLFFFNWPVFFLITPVTRHFKQKPRHFKKKPSHFKQKRGHFKKKPGHFKKKPGHF